MPQYGTIYASYQRDGVIDNIEIYITRLWFGQELILAYQVDCVPAMDGAIIFDTGEEVGVMCAALRNHVADQMEIPEYDLAFTSRGLM